MLGKAVYEVRMRVIQYLHTLCDLQALSPSSPLLLMHMCLKISEPVSEHAVMYDLSVHPGNSG